MTPRDFCYWLQGFYEINNNTNITPEQSIVIRNHLNLVFKHVLDQQYPEEKRTELQNIHDGKTKPGPRFEAMC